MGERVKLEDAKVDIRDAFNAAVAASYDLAGDATADLIDARDRVLVFLAQVETDQKELGELKAAKRLREKIAAEAVGRKIEYPDD